MLIVAYAAAALLEIAGIALVFVGLKVGRDRAAQIRNQGPLLTPTHNALGRKLAPGEGVARAARHAAREHEAEIVALLEGHWTATYGAGLLIVGVILGTIANIANT